MGLFYFVYLDGGIPGTKGILLNICGSDIMSTGPYSAPGDNDLQVFTRNGVHLAGTPLSDFVFNTDRWGPTYADETSIDFNSRELGFTSADYDGSNLNSGPAVYDPTGQKLAFSTYNGMTIGYSGDPDRYETGANFDNGKQDVYKDFEVLYIDEATEDLVIWMPGSALLTFKMFSDAAANPAPPPPPPPPPPVPTPDPGATGGAAAGLPVADVAISIKTQSLAQQALGSLDDAIVIKDTIRAHLGATQNRLENTVTNLSNQSLNLQASESRISDVDVATEMTAFVRSQILSEASVAMLAQANALPKMVLGILRA